MSPAEISALAGKLGIGLSTSEIIAYRPRSDGLSGGVSWLYSLRGKLISCHWAGVAHDKLYDRGGTSADRKRADRLFCYAAALSGKFIPGWMERLYAGTRKRDRLLLALLWWWPFPRLAWRCFRAVVMFGFVRAFGWLPKYWNSREII